MVESKHINKITAQEALLFRKEIPEDYHCNCEYCRENFIGEIFNTDVGKYYSQRCRNSYYPKDTEKKFKHLDVGHWPGYRFAVHHYTNPGDIVFDPTVGSGTAIAEAENNHRRGIGVELEFPEVADFFCNGRGTVIHGNALKVNPDDFLEKESIQLLINGTPYPTVGAVSSDAPERKTEGSLKDYMHKENLGKLKLDEYYDIIPHLYLRWIPYIKKEGYLGIIIKDMMMNKEPYLLHKYIIDSILEKTDELVYDSCFIHKHTPSTMFMNTYPKRFPGIKIPLYQTAIILRKIK